MAEIKFVTLNGLKKFKELLDSSYSEKFAEKNQPVEVGNNNSCKCDEGFENFLDDTYGYNFATDEEVDNLLDDIFGS